MDMQLTNDQIREILPHRYPFLLVDRIDAYVPGEWAEGIKCVSANEMQFLGHFPERSIMPGVLIVEALAQTGAIAILTVPENKGKLAVFTGMKNVKFKYQVSPGDVLTMHSELTAQKGMFGFAKGIAKVGDKIACTAEFSFAIIESEV